MAPGTSLQVDPVTLSHMMESKEAVTILDIREPWERDICAIEGSVFIPMDQLPSRLEELPTDRTLAVVCHHGMRSLHATMWLRRNGYSRAVNLSGGIDAWKTDVEPTMHGY